MQQMRGSEHSVVQLIGRLEERKASGRTLWKGCIMDTIALQSNKFFLRFFFFNLFILFIFGFVGSLLLCAGFL